MLDDNADLSRRVDEAGLLPPWVTEYSIGYARYHDRRLSKDHWVEWSPLTDYQYAFWLMEHCGLWRLPFHDGLEDIPRAVIRAALVRTLCPVVVQKKE